LLTEKLLPLLQQAPHGRIVQVASSFHVAVDGSDLAVTSTTATTTTTTTTAMAAPIASRPGGSNGFFFFRTQRQYANSKLAQILHARALNRADQERRERQQQQQLEPTDDAAPPSSTTSSSSSSSSINTVRTMSICPSWVATQIGGPSGGLSHRLLQFVAFPADGYGLSSLLAALFYIPTSELFQEGDDDKDKTTKYRRPSPSFHQGGHQWEDFIGNSNLFSFYFGFPRPSWAYSWFPLSDILIGGAAHFLLLPGQRFAAWTGPMKSSYESYNITLQDELYEWSKAAVAPYL
jgi:hypothetical protein